MSDPQGINFLVHFSIPFQLTHYFSSNPDDSTIAFYQNLTPSLVNSPSSLVEHLDNKILKSYDFSEIILGNGDAISSKILAGVDYKNIRVIIYWKTLSSSTLHYIGEYYIDEYNIGPLNIKFKIKNSLEKILKNPLGAPYSFNNIGLSVEGEYKEALYREDSDAISIQNQKTVNGWKLFGETASRYLWVGGPNFYSSDPAIWGILYYTDDQNRSVRIFETPKIYNPDGSDLFIYFAHSPMGCNDIACVYDWIMKHASFPNISPLDTYWYTAITSNFPHFMNKIYGIEEGKKTTETAIGDIMKQTASYFWVESDLYGYYFYACPMIRESSENYSVHSPRGYTPLTITEDMILPSEFNGENKRFIRGRYQIISLKASYYHNPSLFGLNGNYQHESARVYREGECITINGDYLYNTTGSASITNIAQRLNRFGEKRRVEVSFYLPFLPYYDVLPRLGDMFDLKIIIQKGRSPNNFGINSSYNCFYREIFPAENRILIKGEKWEFI